MGRRLSASRIRRAREYPPRARPAMRRSTVAPALIALLILVGPLPLEGAQALSFAATPLRVGDVLVYERLLHEVAQTADGTTVEDVSDEVVVVVEGRTTVRDRYGLDREVDAILVQHQEGGVVTHARRCYDWDRIPVRVDYLVGGPQTERELKPFRSHPDVIADASVVQRTNTTYTTKFWGECRFDMISRIDDDADRISASLVRQMPGMPDEDTFRASVFQTSAPLRIGRGEFEGRDALTFAHAFEPRREDPVWFEGELEYTLANGFPGAVALRMHRTTHRESETVTLDIDLRLVGFSPGKASLIESRESRRYGGSDPDPRVPLVEQSRLSAPVEMLELKYPFDEALAALMNDAQVGLREWFAAHPKAGVSHALYDREMRGISRPDYAMGAPTVTDGGWIIELHDGASTFAAQTTRATGVGNAFVGAPLPLKVTTNIRYTDPELDDEETTIPERFMRASPEHLLALIEMAEVDLTKLRAIDYKVTSYDGEMATMDLSVAEIPFWSTPQEGPVEGHVALLYPRAGALAHIALTTQAALAEEFAVPLATSHEVRPAPGAGLAALESPGLAAAALIGGLALLGLLVKAVLLPLYSRLRRDRLLDNPVRARLYERVRAEPGIHRAELIDFAGIGEGATRHHLQQLVDNGLLVELTVGGFARYFAAGEVPADIARREAVLLAGSHRAVYDFYVARPDASLREASRELGVSAPSVHRAKKKLEKAGLLPSVSTASVAEA